MREPTSPVWCGGASRSSFALRNDPILVPPSVAGNLARSSSDTSPAVLIVAVYKWRADHKGSTLAGPFPTRATPSQNKLPCAGVAPRPSPHQLLLSSPPTAIPPTLLSPSPH